MKRRPPPESFLASIQEERSSQTRGHLKIYLGMAAGVGKTFAMLTDALEQKAQGLDVVAGYIEPHGRKDTSELANKLESLPTKEFKFKQITLQEFDVDAALARRADITLVDELAHTNAAGSRHPKRWQDVNELVDAGLTVYTTVNIQHLESLRDVVAQITGVEVQETIPDSILAKADEVELIDLPPKDLIQRLKAGKVYPQERVGAALANFFREGNLLALRELVLRRTAERVDAQMQRYRLRHAVEEIWPTRERVMVCVGPSPMASKLVRAAHRLATDLRAEVLAVSLASPQFLARPAEERVLATEAMELAESLGAKTITRAAQDMVGEILRIANEENVTSIVIGKPIRSHWRNILSRSLVDEILRRSSGVSLYIISAEGEQQNALPLAFTSLEPPSVSRMVLTILIVTLITALGFLVSPILELANICMLYLLGVAFVASRFSWREATLASLLSVGAFDFFFVPPFFTFAVSDIQYVVTFVVMLIISISISTLTLRLRYHTRLVGDRERRTASLYELSEKLLVMGDLAGLGKIVEAQGKLLFKCEVRLLLPDESDSLRPIGTVAGQYEQSNENAVAQWVLEHNSVAGIGTDTLAGSKGFYVPLGAPRAKGVLSLALESPLDHELRLLLDAFVNQITLALERILLEQESKLVELRAEGEHLRSTLLSSISHDFRTPLTVISGAAHALLENSALSSNERRELILNIGEESERLAEVVRNVLDLTGLETGQMKLMKEWHSLEEIVGAALARTSKLLGNRAVKVLIPGDFPFIEVNGNLFEQLFVNLLENAAKHTPAGTSVTIEAHVQGQLVEIRLRDTGPGLKPGEETLIFQKLYRGDPNVHGFGLGLAISRAIMTAHGGSISARNVPSGGVEFLMTLPQVNSAPEAKFV